MSVSFNPETTHRYDPGGGGWLNNQEDFISPGEGETGGDHWIQLLNRSSRPSFYSEVNAFNASMIATVATTGLSDGASTTAASLQELFSTNLMGLNDTALDPYKFNCTHIDKPESVATFEFWTCGILLNLVGILGIFGNILSIIILSRPQMRSSINYLLIALARCDILLIITSILLFGFPAIYEYTGQLFVYYFYVFPHISPYFFPVAMCAQTASIYLTFTVTLERFVAVCHPLRARALCTYGRAKLYVIGCWTFSLVFNLPHFWDVNVHPMNYDEDTVVYCLSASDLRSDRDYVNIYIHWMSLVVLYIIPFTTLAILNTLIYRQVRKANRERQRLSRTEKREIGLATMLLCVVLVFFVCNVLSMINNILEAIYDIINDYLVKSSNLLVTFNSSINFVIYVIFGEKFKRIFLLLFCTGRVGRESPDGLMHDDSSFSNGENRCSGRFQRHGTSRSVSSSRTNGTSVRMNRSVRINRAPSPGPIVYYPARDSSLRSSTYIPRSTSMQNGATDWERESNGNGVAGLTTTKTTTTTTVGF